MGTLASAPGFSAIPTPAGILLARSAAASACSMAADVAGLAGAWRPGSPLPQAMAPGRTKVAPCDMADVGVVGFIDCVPVIVIKWLGHPAASPSAAAGVRQQ